MVAGSCMNTPSAKLPSAKPTRITRPLPPAVLCIAFQTAAAQASQASTQCAYLGHSHFAHAQLKVEHDARPEVGGRGVVPTLQVAPSLHHRPIFDAVPEFDQYVACTGRAAGGSWGRVVRLEGTPACIPQRCAALQYHSRSFSGDPLPCTALHSASASVSQSTLRHRATMRAGRQDQAFDGMMEQQQEPATQAGNGNGAGVERARATGHGTG